MTDPTSRTGTDTARAARLLQEGQLVAIPTETVYGLGADATSPGALSRLYRAKGRPASHPVIVHLGSIDKLNDWVLEIPSEVEVLAKYFWPGPLTLVLRKNASVLDQITGGQDTVAIRIPDHPLTLELLQLFGSGIAAPSANKFGRLSPTSARDVSTEFGDEVSYILDGGEPQVGIESTILDLSSGNLRILRPGKISKTELEKVLRKTVVSQFENPEDNVDKGNTTVIRTPGSLKSHYAPVKPLHLVESSRLKDVLTRFLLNKKKPALLSFQAIEGYSQALNLRAEPDSNIYARTLYANLRYLDSLECDCILVECPPLTPSWSAVNDRLNRAAINHL